MWTAPSRAVKTAIAVTMRSMLTDDEAAPFFAVEVALADGVAVAFGVLIAVLLASTLLGVEVAVAGNKVVVFPFTTTAVAPAANEIVVPLTVITPPIVSVWPPMMKAVWPFMAV